MLRRNELSWIVWVCLQCIPTRQVPSNIILFFTHQVCWSATCTSPTLFAPQDFASAWLSISLGSAVIPRGNKKQRLCKIGGGGGNLRCIMGDVQVANRPVSKYQNSFLALRLRGTTQKKWILESKCHFFSFTPLSLEAQYEFNNNIRKRPSI